MLTHTQPFFSLDVTEYKLAYWNVFRHWHELLFVFNSHFIYSLAVSPIPKTPAISDAWRFKA